jgi:hypothetical protein
MLNKLHTLSNSELERLYVEEKTKLMYGMTVGFSYNTLQLHKVNLNQINYEITRRKPVIRRAV